MPVCKVCLFVVGLFLYNFSVTVKKTHFLCVFCAQCCSVARSDLMFLSPPLRSCLAVTLVNLQFKNLPRISVWLVCLGGCLFTWAAIQKCAGTSLIIRLCLTWGKSIHFMTFGLHCITAKLMLHQWVKSDGTTKQVRFYLSAHNSLLGYIICHWVVNYTWTILSRGCHRWSV